jgi:guanylate kinase
VTRGVILYGPPAAGKDTITTHLHTLNPAYVLFPRLKAGPGRAVGYRLTTSGELDRLATAGAIVWENSRYGARYAIDLPELDARLHAQVPVLHLGQVPAIEAVKKATPDTNWLVVSVWCSRDEAAHRIEQRATGDTMARLAAWDETEPLDAPDLVVDTTSATAQAAAEAINRRIRIAEAERR